MRNDQIHYSKNRQNDTTFEIEFQGNKFEIRRTKDHQFYWLATDINIELYEDYSQLFDFEKEAYVNLFDVLKEYSNKIKKL